MGEDDAVPEESDVTSPELHCARLGACRGHCVLARTEKKKESNCEEVRNGIRFRGCLRAIVSDDALDGADWKSKLWFGSRISIFVRFQEARKGKVEVFGAECAARVGISSQHEGL
jgi:hypothetical protein